MIEKIKKSKFIEIIKNPVMSVLPGQLAFSFILTLIPIILIIASISYYFGLSLDEIIIFINKSFPTQVSELFVPLISGKGFDFQIFIFIIMAFWLASNGPYAIITASNLIYNFKDKNYFRKKLKSILITFILIAIFIFLLIVLAFGELILNKLILIESISFIIIKIQKLYYLIKYPLSFISIYFSIKLIYTISPDVLIPSKSVTKGTIFTSIMWIIVTYLYSIWVNNANYDIFYGSISNIIILLIWMWFLAYIFVIGLIINNMNYIDINAH